MNCNWELFEFRVKIYARGNNAGSGNFSGTPIMEFYNVGVDLKSFGLTFSSTQNNQCNFKSVFSALAKLKVIPFGFLGEQNAKDRLGFGNLQAGYKNGVTFRAAKLYVHRRDSVDVDSDSTGPGILLENVNIGSAVQSKNGNHVFLNGDKGNVVN